MIYNNHRVAFDDKTITITDKNGKNQMTTWEDITNLKYDTWSSSIVLKSKIKNKCLLCRHKIIRSSIGKKYNSSNKRIKITNSKID